MLKVFVSVSMVYALGVALTLGINIFLARWLPIGEFGAYGYAISLATLLSIPVSGGLPLLLMRETSASIQAGGPVAAAPAISASVGWVVISSSVTYVVAAAFAGRPWLGPSDPLYMSILMVPAIGLMAIGEGALKGLGKPLLAEGLRQVVVPILLLCGLLGISIVGYNNATSVLTVTATTYMGVGAVLTVASLKGAGYRIAASGTSQIKRWLAAMVSFALIGGMATLTTQTATIVLGVLGDDRQVAFLRVAERAAIFVGLPQMFMNGILGPHVVRYSKQDAARATLQAVSRTAARLTFAASGVMALTLTVFGRTLIELSFGANYVEGAYLPLVILSFAQVLGAAFGAPGLLLMMTGNESGIVLAQVLGTSIMVFSIVPLTAVFDVAGAAAGAAAGLIAINLFVALAVRRRLGFIPGIL